MDVYIAIAMIWLSGFIFAKLMDYLKRKRITIGTLHIDNSDPDKEKYCFEILEVSMKDLPKQKYAFLKIETTSNNESHE